MTRPESEALPRKVVVALDGSAAAATALPVAQVLSDQLGAMVEVLHVATSGTPDTSLWRHLHADLRPTDEVRIVSNVANPAAAILRAAREPGVELVVLTTHGREIEAGRSLGRVAQQVISSARQPVLLVRPEAAAEFSTGPIRRLLLPVDGTRDTMVALAPVIELARRLRAALQVLYVVSLDDAVATESGAIGAPAYLDQPQHDWAAWQERLLDHLAANVGEELSEFALDVALGVGEDIGSEIVQFAVERQPDAVVLVRRSHLELGRARALRGVLDRVSLPILLVGADTQNNVLAATPGVARNDW